MIHLLWRSMVYLSSCFFLFFYRVYTCFYRLSERIKFLPKKVQSKQKRETNIYTLNEAAKERGKKNLLWIQGFKYTIAM